MTLFTRWSTDPDYCDAVGRPRVLSERKGGRNVRGPWPLRCRTTCTRAPCCRNWFGSASPSSLRGNQQDADDRVRLCADAFVPKDGAAEMLQLRSDNVGDHLAAAVQNVIGNAPPMLEQSIFADKLRPAIGSSR